MAEGGDREKRGRTKGQRRREGRGRKGKINNTWDKRRQKQTSDAEKLSRAATNLCMGQ